MATVGFPNAPGAYTLVSNEAGPVSVPGGIRKIALIGEGIKYRQISNEPVIRGITPRGEDSLSQLGVFEIISVGLLPNQSDFVNGSDFIVGDESISWGAGGAVDVQLGTATNRKDGFELASQVVITRNADTQVSGQIISQIWDGNTVTGYVATPSVVNDSGNAVISNNPNDLVISSSISGFVPVETLDGETGYFTLSGSAPTSGDLLTATYFQNPIANDLITLTVTVAGGTGVGRFTLSDSIGTVFSNPYTNGSPVTDVPGITFTVLDTSTATTGETIVIRTTSASLDDVIPSEGSTYYVTYRVAKAAADYEPQVFRKQRAVNQAYGNPSVENSLSLGAQLVFQNNASEVTLVQVENSSASAYSDALTKLSKINVDTIVPLSGNTTIWGLLSSHVVTMSSVNFRLERIGIIGLDIDPLAVSMRGTGVRPPSDFIAVAQGFSNDRIVTVAPEFAVLELIDDDGFPYDATVPGYFIAAALGGLDASPERDPATPITHRSVVGFKSLAPDFDDLDKRDLIAGGVTLIERVGTSARVLMAITTNVSNALTREITVIEIKDYVAQACRAGVDQFIGKKLTLGRPGDVAQVVTNILQIIRSNEIINAFADIESEQDSIEPTQINVSFRIKPTFTTNWIVIAFVVTPNL